MIEHVDYDLTKFPADREIVVDAGYLGTGRHVIYALLEIDVTRPRELIMDRASHTGDKLSFTAFLVASFAEAIKALPQVHAFLDWRHRLVTFHDVDVVTMIEPEKGAVAIPHIIRNANNKSVVEISREIREVQAHPKSSQQASRLQAIGPRIPRIGRLLYFRFLKMSPNRFKRVAGTVVLTSVGMFGRGGGWGIGFLPLHNLGMTVGGISKKPGVHQGQISIREFLNLTITFDHDIIDGAPAARFASVLVDKIESGAVFDSIRN